MLACLVFKGIPYLLGKHRGKGNFCRRKGNIICHRGSDITSPFCPVSHHTLDGVQDNVNSGE